MAAPQRRLEKVLGHLQAQTNGLSFQETAGAELSDNDVVIVSAVRTPITKAKRGGLATVHWTDLLGVAMKGAVQRINLNPDEIQDMQVGTVLAPGGGAHQARMAQFVAGFSENTSLASTNRQCSSGLQAVANIAASIRSGFIDMGMACGVESMSGNDMAAAVGSLNDKHFEHEKAKSCLIPMGITSENVAEKYGVTREEQDAFALASQQKAFKAQQDGNFKEEIVAVPVTLKNEDGTTKEILVAKDDGIRVTKAEDLAKLRPAFKQGGTTTAGNSSQVSDGAAAVILCSRKKAKELGLKPIGRFIAFSVVGVPPEVMGIGPAFAIPDVLKKAGLKVDDIDVFEINEAFASQAVYSVKKLGINPTKVNPNGGAIALGHPLGCTGARQVSTLLNQLKRQGGKYGVTSMCIGTGMGAAAVFALE